MHGARLAWGWHQLRPAAAERLVADARLPPRCLVLDVGAGLGAVTGPLVEAGHRVVAVERHPGRAAQLRRRFGDAVVVVRADAADLRLPRRPFHVVANPPFAVTGALLERLLHPGSRLVSARLIVQDAAARRWATDRRPRGGGRPGPFELVAGPRVPRRAFVPPPRVDGRILEISRRATGA